MWYYVILGAAALWGAMHLKLCSSSSTRTADATQALSDAHRDETLLWECDCTSHTDGIMQSSQRCQFCGSPKPSPEAMIRRQEEVEATLRRDSSRSVRNQERTSRLVGSEQDASTQLSDEPFWVTTPGFSAQVGRARGIISMHPRTLIAPRQEGEWWYYKAGEFGGARVLHQEVQSYFDWLCAEFPEDENDAEFHDVDRDHIRCTESMFLPPGQYNIKRPQVEEPFRTGGRVNALMFRAEKVVEANQPFVDYTIVLRYPPRQEQPAPRLQQDEYTPTRTDVTRTTSRDWKCPTCTYLNEVDKTGQISQQCMVCQGPRT